MNITMRRGVKPHRYQVNLYGLMKIIALAALLISSLGYYLFCRHLRSNLPRDFRKIRRGQSSISAHHNFSQSSKLGGNDKIKAVIGYAITVTGCPKDDGSRGDFGAGITDGAAVLKHSIHLNSIQNTDSGSKYDYQMYALVHPDADSCARRTLESLGYQLMIRSEPVKLIQIRGKYLREKVPNNGCCGEKEFVKIHAYTLVKHPVVVHLDLDTLVLKPMDHLFDVIIDGAMTDWSYEGVEVAFNDPILPNSPGKNTVDAFFTRDYNMAHRGMKHVGVQGGFLVLRPSLDVFSEFSSIIRQGDFQPDGGWGGLGFGPFYGSMTFQGIIPYFYDHIHPGTGVELNRCVYNNMADNPRDQSTINDIVSGSCRDGYNRPDKNDECEDCRSRSLDEVVTTHFTLCQKPWECLPHDGDRIQERLCRKFHAEWYRIREDLETKMWGNKEIDLSKEDDLEKERGGKFQPQHFRGFCKSHGKNGYIAMKVPTNSGLIS